MALVGVQVRAGGGSCFQISFKIKPDLARHLHTIDIHAAKCGCAHEGGRCFHPPIVLAVSLKANISNPNLLDRNECHRADKDPRSTLSAGKVQLAAGGNNHHEQNQGQGPLRYLRLPPRQRQQRELNSQRTQFLQGDTH